jgi:mono/diheme cytochrome c family protein
MGRVRSCATAMIAIGAVLSIMSPVRAQDAASAQDQAKVAAGENVYNYNCQTCHGEQLESTGQVFDLRRLTANDHARFENSVRNGKKQMPPWKGILTDEQIDQLWYYIRANAFKK